MQRGQVEIAGGGFYEPILIAIPPEDRHEQITRLSRYVENHFGSARAVPGSPNAFGSHSCPPRLRLLASNIRLWTTIIFSARASSLISSTATISPKISGHSVKVLPGLKALRYLLPFHAPKDTIEFLRASAKEHPGGFAAMGDDLEKFGVWPGTNKLCYTDGWLENLFVALEQNSDWLETATPAARLPRTLRSDAPIFPLLPTVK